MKNIEKDALDTQYPISFFSLALPPAARES